MVEYMSSTVLKLKYYFRQPGRLPLAVLGLSLATVLVVLIPELKLVRGPLVGLFLLFGPGLALVPLLKLKEPAVLLTLIIGLSLALDMIVALAFLYLSGYLMSGGVLAGLEIITLSGALLQLWSLRKQSSWTE